MDADEANAELVTITEFHCFLKLPRDLIKLLMLEYFYSSDALTCLRVCKFLKNLLNDREIEMLRIKVVKLIAMEEQLAWLDALHIQCKLCGAELAKESMPRHIRKHEKRFKQGKPIQRIKAAFDPPLLCELCNVPHFWGGPHN